MNFNYPQISCVNKTAKGTDKHFENHYILLEHFIIFSYAEYGKKSIIYFITSWQCNVNCIFFSGFNVSIVCVYLP